MDNSLALNSLKAALVNIAQTQHDQHHAPGKTE